MDSFSISIENITSINFKCPLPFHVPSALNMTIRFYKLSIRDFCLITLPSPWSGSLLRLGAPSTCGFPHSWYTCSALSLSQVEPFCEFRIFVSSCFILLHPFSFLHGMQKSESPCISENAFILPYLIDT